MWIFLATSKEAKVIFPRHEIFFGAKFDFKRKLLLHLKELSTAYEKCVHASLHGEFS
jgi:hypothetical protein